MSKTAIGLMLFYLAAGFSVAKAAQISGQTASGAYYAVEVPNGWTPVDGLVIFNRGFDLSPPQPVTDLGPLMALQLSEGYAVAASSYSLTGWSLFNSRRDLQQLLAAFTTAFAAPQQIIVYGASVGGLVSVQAAETGALGPVAGVLAVCAPLAGSRFWDGVLDLRLLYDNVCQGIAGAQIPGGAGGLPNPHAFDQNDLGIALNACTGLPNPPTSQQAQNLGVLLSLSGLPQEFLATDLGLATFGLNDLVYDPRKLNGAQAMDNSTVIYGDAMVDQQITRVSADVEARNRLFQNYTPNGQLLATRALALHTDKDGLALVEHVAEYAALAPPDRFSAGIVVEDSPTHCGFTEAELVAAWESLRGWIAGLPQPSAMDLQNTCLALVGANLAVGPCRIDPGFVPGSLDSRIPVRSGFVPLPQLVPSLSPWGLTALLAILWIAGWRILRRRA